jgi:hypothetical protein
LLSIYLANTDGYRMQGMMYYQNDVWATEGVAERCGSPAKCKLCDCGPNQSAFSEWIPESYPGPFPGKALNGDGSLTYPGTAGPLSTIRLENIVDGLEVRKTSVANPCNSIQSIFNLSNPFNPV